MIITIQIDESRIKEWGSLIIHPVQPAIEESKILVPGFKYLVGEDHPTFAIHVQMEGQTVRESGIQSGVEVRPAMDIPAPVPQRQVVPQRSVPRLPPQSAPLPFRQPVQVQSPDPSSDVPLTPVNG